MVLEKLRERGLRRGLAIAARPRRPLVAHRKLVDGSVALEAWLALSPLAVIVDDADEPRLLQIRVVQVDDGVGVLEAVHPCDEGLDSGERRRALAPVRCVCPAVEERLQDLKPRSEEHTSELQSRLHLVCRLLLEK